MRGLTIDPGMSTGVCLFDWSDEFGFRVVMRWQFQGGAEALRMFLTHHGLEVRGWNQMYFQGEPLDNLIVEKFTPRTHEGFSLTLKSVEPLRGEGVLIGMGLNAHISWRQPSQQYFSGGDSLPDKKKRSREFLKLHDFYITGKPLGQKDADDAISATLHSIAWLRSIKHMPTLRELFPPMEGSK